MLAFPGQELLSLVAISFWDIAGPGCSSAVSVIIPRVSQGVPSVAGDFQMINLLLLIFLFHHIFLSFSAHFMFSLSNVM